MRAGIRDVTSREEDRKGKNQNAKFDQNALYILSKVGKEIGGHLADILSSFLEPILDGSPDAVRDGRRISCIGIFIDNAELLIPPLGGRCKVLLFLGIDEMVDGASIVAVVNSIVQIRED